MFINNVQLQEISNLFIIPNIIFIVYGKGNVETMSYLLQITGLPHNFNSDQLLGIAIYNGN